MHYSEINKRYTAVIAEYLAKGYAISTCETGGDLNGYAHNDLTNGAETIRIIVRSTISWSGAIMLKQIKILVGRAVADGSDGCVKLWGKAFTIIRQEQFYEIGTDRGYGTFYGTREEAIAAEQLRTQRSGVRKVSRKIEFTSPKALEIAKRAIRRMLAVKHIDDDDVRIVKTLGKRGEYFILFKDGVLGLQ